MPFPEIIRFSRVQAMKPSNNSDISFICDKGRRLRTSAEIVKEARMSIALTADKGKAKLVAATRRPETPGYAHGRWTKVHTSARLLPMVSEVAPLNSCGTNSINGEPELQLQRLNPVLQRSQTVSQGTSNKTQLLRRRPLSGLATSVTCDEAFLSLQYDIESRTLRNALPSPIQLGHTVYGVSNSLPALPFYDNRVSLVRTNGMVSKTRSSSTASPRVDENMQTCLKQLASFSVNGDQADEELDAVLESFLACLSDAKHFLKRGHTRTIIFETLYQIMDEKKPLLTIRVLTALLAINMHDRNLVDISKAIYSLCGHAENHIWFKHELFIQHFLSTLQCLSLDDIMSLSYLICSLDILTTNDAIRRQLLDMPIFESISHLLQLLMVQASQELLRPSEIPTSFLLIPTLSSIRSLLDAGRVAKQALLRQDILQQVLQGMTLYNEESELVLYGMRILSKLSLHEECCEQLLNMEPDFFLSSATWLSLYSKNQDIIVRLLFVLGNLLSMAERAQWQLFQAPGVISAFQCTFEHFLGMRQLEQQEKANNASSADDCAPSMSLSGQQTEQSTSDSWVPTIATEDVLVKLARVLANLSVHPGIGSVLCQNEKLLNHLCAVLELEIDTEELVVNTLVALHNLSFYPLDEDINSRMLNRLGESVFLIINTSASLHCCSEACSLLANLTRDVRFSDWVLQKQVHQKLISFLDISSSMQLTKSAAGTLINLSRCGQHREILLNSDLLSKTYDLLKQSVMDYNWYLASLAAQIVCNLTRPSDGEWMDRNCFLNQSILRDVANLLLEHTEDSTLTSPIELQDHELISQLRQIWEQEFCTASTELLEILDSTVCKIGYA